MSEVLYCPECKKESAGGYIICEECYEQLLIKLAAEQKDRKFPLLQQGANIGSVPWWVAEQAYMGYASKYGDQQSLERLAERGGFGIDEMDEYFPDWRDKCSIITKLQAELATAKEENKRYRTALQDVMDAKPDKGFTSLDAFIIKLQTIARRAL